MMESVWFWVLWGAFLLAQNFSFTMVSRARNSGSLIYHAIAALGSNGIWFISQMFLLAQVFKKLMNDFDAWGLIGVGVFYTIATVVGSLTAHYVLMKYVEKGKRQVGAK